MRINGNKNLNEEKRKGRGGEVADKLEEWLWTVKMNE
jgi:hypothetical protein